MTGAPAQETSDLHFGQRITWETIHRLCMNKQWPPWRNNMVHASRSLSDSSVNSLSRTIWIVSRYVSFVAGSEFQKTRSHFPYFPFFHCAALAFHPIFSIRSSPGSILWIQQRFFLSGCSLDFFFMFYTISYVSHGQINVLRGQPLGAWWVARSPSEQPYFRTYHLISLLHLFFQVSSCIQPTTVTASAPKEPGRHHTPIESSHKRCTLRAVLVSWSKHQIWSCPKTFLTPYLSKNRIRASQLSEMETDTIIHPRDPLNAMEGRPVAQDL